MMLRPALIAVALLLCCGWSIAQKRGDAKKFAVIGYYAGNGEDLEKHRIEQLTHLIWCFTHLEGDSMVAFPSSEPYSKAREKTIREMVGFKQRNPALKVLLSFGGWGGCATCSEVFSRDEGRRKFAASALRLMQRYHVDGLDIDWEYPAVQGPEGHRFAPEDKHDFTLLMQELRKAFGTRYEISFAVGGPDECILGGFEWNEVMPLVDRVHIMSYDLVHGFSKSTGHHTPLYSCAGQSLSADHAVHLLDSLHVPREKIVIGSAFYARIWRDVPEVNNGLFQPGVFSRTVPHNAIDTVINEAHGFEWFRDTIAQAPYAYNRTTHEFVTCDDAISVALKTRYAVEQGLSGIMFWQIRDDKERNGLLQAMHAEVGSSDKATGK